MTLKINIARLLLGLIIIFNENLFYIFDFTSMRFTDVSIILIILLFILSRVDILRKKKYSIQIEILIFIVLIGISLLMSSLRGENVYEIITNYRYMMLYLLYFPLNKFFAKENNRLFISKLISIFGVGYAAACLIQYSLYPKIIFLNGISFGSRGNDLRFYSGFYIVVFSIFFLISFYFKSKSIKNNIFYSIGILINFVYLIQVSLIRNVIFSVIVTFCILIIIQKKYKKFTKLIFSSVLIGVFLYFFNDNLSIFLESSISDSTGTGAFRIDLYGYILHKLLKSPIFGFGFMSPNSIISPYNIHVDTGFFGFFYEFGLVGLFWSLYVLMKFWRMTYRLYRFNIKESYLFIAYFTYTIVIFAFNCPFNLKELILQYLIMQCLLENTLRELEDTNDNESFSNNCEL